MSPVYVCVRLCVCVQAMRRVLLLFNLPERYIGET